MLVVGFHFLKYPSFPLFFWGGGGGKEEKAFVNLRECLICDWIIIVTIIIIVIVLLLLL